MTLEELLVKIRVENKQAVKGLNDAKKAATQAENQFGKLRNGLKTLKAQMRAKTNNAYARELSKGYKSAKKSLDDLLKSQNAMKRRNTTSPQYKQLTAEITKAERALDKLIEQQVAWAESGIDPNSGPFQALDEQIETTRARLDGLYQKQKDMATSGSTKAEAEEWNRIQEKIAEARAEVARYERLLAGVGVGNPAVQRISAILSAVRKAGAGIKNFGVKSAHAIKGVVGWLRKLGRGFGTVLSKIPLLNRIPGIFKKMKRGMFMGAGLRSMLRLGTAGFLIYKAFSMAREGMQNLARYSGQTNSDLSMLMSSLATLKNALATAFAPILTAVAPALNYLIQLLVQAATAVAHFTAAFTGKSTVVVAKQQNLDYAASLGDAADAAGSASDAAKEYQKTLLGFDQINVLNDTDNSSGGSGGGAGGGAGGFGDMFETVEVDAGASNLVDRIKEAWKNADFTDLGRDIGNKIADELNKIPWEKLQNVAYKIGKSIATGFNGLNDSAFWGTLGHSVAESLNTVLTGIEGFVLNFEWKKAGLALADGINHLFLDFDWRKLGETFSNGAKGILDGLKGLFDGIKWEDIGRSVMSAITHVDWVGIIVKGIRAAGSLATGILNFIKGAFEQAAESVKVWISSGKIWEDIGSLGKAVFDIGVNIVGAAWNTLRTILSGIWDVVKAIASHFGIEEKYSYGLHDTGMTGGDFTKKLYDLEVEKSNDKRLDLRGEPMVIQYTSSDQKKQTEATKKSAKTVSDIWKDFKKKWDEVPRQLSVAGAFGYSPQSSGSSIFGSLNSASAKAKIKVTAELTKVDDRIPTGKKFVSNMLAKLDRKNETFSKVTDAMTAALPYKSEDFDHWTKPMGSWMTYKSEDFDHWTKPMGSWMTYKSEDFDHWTKPMGSWMTHKSEDFSHWTNKMGSWMTHKSEDFDHWTSGMTAWITSVSFASKARQILLSAFAEGGVYRNGRWQPVTMAAGGGSFTTGQMFVAREAGPELVGKIGTGSTVMNNDQIVASVSAGVAKGAYEAFVSAFRDTGGNSTQVVLEGDAAKLFRAVQRQAVQYINSTGESPFPV